MADFESIVKSYVNAEGFIPADAIAKLTKAISTTVGNEFVDKERYKGKLTEIDTLKAEKQTAEDNATTAGKWKEDYESLKQQFDQYKVDQQNKEISAARGNAAKEILKAAGLSGKTLEMAAALYKKDALELDESGKAKDFDNLVSAAKTEYAEMIPKSGYTPPVGVSIKTFTPDDIRKMTPAEINKNFDAIKASLKGEK